MSFSSSSSNLSFSEGGRGKLRGLQRPWRRRQVKARDMREQLSRYAAIIRTISRGRLMAHELDEARIRCQALFKRPVATSTTLATTMAGSTRISGLVEKDGAIHLRSVAQASTVWLVPYCGLSLGMMIVMSRLPRFSSMCCHQTPARALKCSYPRCYPEKRIACWQTNESDSS